MCSSWQSCSVHGVLSGLFNILVSLRTVPTDHYGPGLQERESTASSGGALDGLQHLSGWLALRMGP